MNKTERNFYNDIRDAVSDWNCSFGYYHEDQFGDTYFCIDITVEDDDADWDEVWDSLEEVTNDWGAGIDQHMNDFSVALNMSD